MRKICLLFSAIVFVAQTSFCQTENKLSKEEKKDGWKLLFNGKNTKGWHKYGGGNSIGKGWKVADGALYLDPTTKDGGDIVTDKEFENFDLKLEWKIAPDGNSGVMFYVHEDTAKFKWAYESGPEMQVLDNIGAEDNKKENHLAGTLYDLLGTAAQSKPKPVGEWNQAEIKCVNGKLDLYFNGVNIVSTTLWDEQWKRMIAGSKFRKMDGFGTYRIGRIDLQDHGYGVWFRNIKIKEL